MHKSYIILVLLTLSAVTGCATQAQKQYQQMAANMEQSRKETDNCYSDLKKEDVYQRVNQIFITVDSDPKALEKMMIERHATQEEKRDLLEMNALTQVCRKVVLESLIKVHSDFVELRAKWYAEKDELDAKILKDTITIGEANKFLNKRRLEINEQHSDISKAILQQLDVLHQSEIENRRNAIAQGLSSAGASFTAASGPSGRAAYAQQYNAQQRYDTRSPGVTYSPDYSGGYYGSDSSHLYPDGAGGFYSD